MDAINFNVAGVSSYKPQKTETGFYGQHSIVEDETSLSMATLVAEQAVLKSGWQKSDIDMIISACAVSPQPIPSFSVQIQNSLGIDSIPCFDVNSTCLSFLNALDIAMLYLSSKRVKRILIVSSEIASSALDKSKPKIADLFGDGASAICIEDKPVSQYIFHKMESHGGAEEFCHLRSGGTRYSPHKNMDAFISNSFFEMSPLSLFKYTKKWFPDFIKQVSAISHIDTVIPHQASPGALKYLESFFPKSHLVNIFEGHGNQIAASIPTTLTHAYNNGLLKKDTISCLIGSSAGISLGASLIRW